MPSTGLTPDRHPGDVLHVLKLFGVLLAIPANEGGIFARALILSTGLELDELALWSSEQRAVEWEVAEEVALAVLHGNDEALGVDAF